MEFRYLYALVLVIAIHVPESSSYVEHNCPRCSKYEYEEKTLEKLIRMEHEWSIFNEKWNSIEKNIKETMVMFKDAEDINNTITNAYRQVIRMSQDMMEYQTAINNTLLAYKATIVFFSVHSPTSKLVDGVPTFRTVLGNMGGGYDTTTGVFTCTVPGLYHFSFTFVRSSTTSGSIYCYIRHNGANTVYAFTYTAADSSSSNYQSASATIYMNLVSGDKVDVGGCNNWNHVNTGRTGMFSGALITAA